MAELPRVHFHGRRRRVVDLDRRSAVVEFDSRGQSSLARSRCFTPISSVLIGKPGINESVDPIMPAIAMVGSFGFAILAMMVLLLSEFEVTMGRTSGGGD